MKILWIQPVFLLFMMVPAENFACDPANDCQSSVVGAFVADPEDCERYYICVGPADPPVPSATSFPCGPGMYFEQSVDECTLETISGVCDSNICACISECPTIMGTLVKAANRNNCSLYYLCISTGPIVTTCLSPTPYFNGEQCVADSSECCDFCTPSCSGPYRQISDPCDCTSYYICDSNSMIKYRSTCPSGDYFEESSGTCKAGTCNSLCSSCGSSPSTTSTATDTATDTTTDTTIDTTTDTIADTTTDTIADTTTDTIADTTTDTIADTTTDKTTDTTTGATTDTTTPDHKCGSSFTCPSDWDYPRCTECDPSYWHCTGGVAYLTYCSGTYVFNTDPLYPYCLSPANCPFHPSIFL